VGPRNGLDDAEKKFLTLLGLELRIRRKIVLGSRASVPAVNELRVPVSSVTVVTGNLNVPRGRGFVAQSSQ
jgi:hypothetical protein